MHGLTIGESARRAAVPVYTIRYYERQGLIARRAKSLGVRSVPAVVINGQLADCCIGRGPDEATLRAAGLGQPL